MTVAIYLFTSIVFLGIAAISALLAYKRGGFKSTVKCVIAILSLVASSLLTLLISDLTRNTVKTLSDKLVLDVLFADNRISALISSSETLEELIYVLPSALISPFVFAILFFLIKLILDVIFKIVSVIFIGNKHIWAFKGSKLVSCVIGVVIAYVCVMAATVPINGIVTISANAYKAIRTVRSDDAEVAELIDDVVDGLNKNPVKVVTYNLGGRALFNSLTSFNVDGKTYSVGEEITNLSSVFAKAAPLVKKDIKSWGEKEADLLRDIPEIISDSELVPAIVSDIVRCASNEWLEGNEFIGVKMPKLKVGTELIESVLVCFKDSNSETIKEDAQTLCETLALLAERDTLSAILSGTTDHTVLLDAISVEGMLGDAFVILHSNARLRPLINTLTDLGIKTAATSMRVPTKAELNEKIYSELSDELGYLYAMPADEMSAAAENSLRKIFDKYGIDTSDETIKVLSDSYVEYFKNDFGTTSEEVASYFEGIYMIDSVKDGDVSKTVLERVIDSFGEDKVVSVFGSKTEQANVAVENITKVVEAISDFSTADSNTVASLAPSVEVVTNATTIESLMTERDFSSATKEEVKDLGDSLSVAAKEISNVMDSMSSLDGSASTTDKIKVIDMQSFGEAFDAIGNNKLIGETATDLLDAGLKSMAGIDISIKEAIDNSDDPGTDDSSYSGMLTGIQNTVLLMEDINNANISHDDKVNKVQEFMENLDSASAKSISKVIDADVVKKLGVSEQNSETTAKAVKQVFVELSKTDDASGKEAEAVKYLLDIVITASNSKGSMFGENGRISDVNAFVTTVINSQVASNVIATMTTDESGDEVADPFGIANKVTDADRTELITALYNAANVSSTTDDQKQVLEDIAQIFGLEWTA